MPVGSVQVVWQLDVSQLRDAARRCAAEQRDYTDMFSSEPSPPLGGISFHTRMLLKFDDGGVKVGLFCTPRSLPHDLLYTCKVKLQVEEFGEWTWTDTSLPLRPKPTRCSMMRGWFDFFQLGPMAGGWDETAWAAKGLPTNGHLTIKLTVSDVPHAIPVPQVPEAPVRLNFGRR